MSRSIVVGTAAFTVSLVALGLVAAWAMDALGWSSTWPTYVVADGVVIWLAVLAGVLLGRLTYGAVAISSICVQVAALGASVVLLAAIAHHGGQPAHWLYLVHALVTPVAVSYAIVGVVSAVVGLFVIRRITPSCALRS